MEFLPASGRSVLLFEGILGIVLVLFLAGVHAASRRLQGPATRRTAMAAGGVAVWLALFGAVVHSGVIEAQPMPRLLILFGTSNAVAVALALSPVGGWLARGLPIAALVGFQGFRVPLEILLSDWARQGTIPASMTWSGSNYDVLSGLLAIVAAPLATRLRPVAWAANVVGFVLLLNVARVAILSSPLPFAWKVDPPLQLGFHLPYAFVVPVLVGGALAGHIILTRALLLPAAGQAGGKA